jgi:Fur family ferric uptake transcriptional regulator
MCGAFAVEDLVRALDSAGESIGLATVYRAVAAMESSGFLTRVGEREGATLYVRCTALGHHHHLVCTGCGQVAHTACPLDDSVLKSVGDVGFEITGHEIVLYGRCEACRTTRATDPAATLS